MNLLKEFIKEEDGVGIVEIILILVVLVALVVIFRSEVESIVKKAFSSINSNSETIINGK